MRWSSKDPIYPKLGACVFFPCRLDGSPGSSVFELAHLDTEMPVYWHLDGKYVGSTLNSQKIPINPGEGQYKFTLVDGTRNVLERYFEVLSN